MSKSFRKTIFARVLSLIICSTVAFTITPCITSFAKTTQESDADQIALLEIVTNDSLVKKAYDAVIRARKSQRESDSYYALSLCRVLSPTNKVRLYVKLSRDYYLANYRLSGFKYFNVEKYLFDNADVRLAGLSEKTDDIYKYALEHYLEYGIFEARESKTAFDPVIAILAEPVSFEQFIIGADSTADTIYEKYVKLTGKKDTTDEKAIWTAPKATDKYKFEPLIHVLSLVKKQHVKAEETGSDHEAIVTASDASDVSETVEQDETVVPVTPSDSSYINNYSVDVNPYMLYTKDGAESFSFRTNRYNYPDAVNGGKAVTVNFNAKNFEKAKELAKDKKYTFMIYMDGTDQEISKYYRRVSIQILSMLQAEDLNNINVLLYVGGTEKYANNYMNQTSKISDLRSGIYYVNPSGLADDIRKNLKKLGFKEEFDQLNTQDLLGILEGTVPDPQGLAHGITYDKVFTPDSLIELSTTSTPTDMTDPAMLSGFINFATDLFPAKEYGLSLSNHGGGLTTGVICTQDYDVEGKKILKGNSIHVYMLESALASTNLYKNRNDNDDGRLGLIFYDACLMGSAEQAYNLKDYYRYMIASEEVTVSYTDYCQLLNQLEKDIKDGSSSKNIAIDMTYDFSQTSWHRGGTNAKMGSIAVFSSDEMKKMYENINKLSDDMTEVLAENKYSSGFKKDFFAALRKASLSGYTEVGDAVALSDHWQGTKAVDIGEFYNFLNANLYKININSEAYNSYDKEALQKVKDSLSKVLNSGFMVYLSTKSFDGFGEIVGDKQGEVIPLNYQPDAKKALWTDVKTGATPKDGEEDYREKIYTYASSIYLPLSESYQDFKKSSFYKYYKGSELDSYVKFVEEYIAVLNDMQKGGYGDDVENLKKEMADNNLYAKLIKQEAGNTGLYSTIEDQNGSIISYISFTVPETYEELDLEAPEHSTGSPMLDIIETCPSIQISAVRKEFFSAYDKEKGKNAYLGVDMICAEKEVGAGNVSVGGNTIYFDVTNMTKSIITGFALVGLDYDETNGKVGDTQQWQYVLKSSLEQNSQDKKDAIQALYNSESIPSEDSVITVTGSVLSKDPDNENLQYVYHVFNSDDGYTSMLSYAGTVKLDVVKDKKGNDKNVFTKIKDPYAISAYHYVLREITDNEGKIIGTVKDVLEGHDGFTDGYFAVPTDSTTNLIVASVNVTEKITEKGQPDTSTGIGTGYVLDMPFQNKYYTDIAYIDEKEYNESNNLGDGLLGLIDVQKAEAVTDENGNFIDQIGGFYYEVEVDEDDYMPIPAEDDKDAPIVNKKADDKAAVNDENMQEATENNLNTENVKNISNETEDGSIDIAVEASTEESSENGNEDNVSINEEVFEESISQNTVTENVTSEEKQTIENGDVISEEKSDSKTVIQDYSQDQEAINDREAVNAEETVLADSSADESESVSEENVPEESIPEENNPVDAVTSEPMDFDTQIEADAA